MANARGYFADYLAGLSGDELTEVRAALSGVLTQKAVVLLMGQSNPSGRGTTLQLYTSSSEKALMLGNDYGLRTITDPVDSAASQVDTVSSDSQAGGSVWPLVANRLAGRTPGLSFIFVPAAKGGTSITAWLPGADHEDRTTLYGSAIHRAKTAGAGGHGVTTLALWWQGETDAAASMSQSTYAGHLATIAAAVKADLGVNLIPCQFQRCTDTPTAAGQSAINAAIAAGGANITAGPDLTSIVVDATDGLGLHLNSNIALSRAADRWVLAIMSALGLPPGLDASSNLVPKSEQFDSWTATSITVTANAIANPVDGATTADLLTSSATTGIQKLITSPTGGALVTAADRDTVSFYVKAGTARYVQLSANSNNFGTGYANFDLQNGVAGNFSGCEVGIEPVAGHTGWYRIQANFGIIATAGSEIVLSFIDSATAARRAVTGNASETLYVFGAQVEKRNSAGPYVATA